MISDKIKKYLTFSKVVALVALIVLIAITLAGNIRAQQFTQGYGADSSLEKGMLVRLKADDGSKVEPVKAKDAEHIHGVVVDPNDAPFTLSSEDEKVFVATSGRYEVLVSDQNGTIEAGDYITISGIDGVGMKADDRSEFVIGRAINGFNGSSGVIGKSKVGEREVVLGRVLTDISIAVNPLYKSDQAVVPEFLMNTATAIAGKKTSAGRVYLGFFVAVASMIIAGSLLYSGIKSSIVSIGRNPLSKKSITQSMIKVIIVALIIFVAGLGTVYLLLKL